MCKNKLPEKFRLNQSANSIFGLILTLFLVTFSIINAGTTGKLAGRIIDSETKEPIIGANIVIKGTNLGASADMEGDFYINNISPGIYTVVVSSIGYNNTTINNIVVRIDLTTRLDVKLTPTTVNMNEIIIQAKQPLVTKDLTSSSAIISSEELKLMPVENLNQVINLQAGVVNGHFRGGRSGEVAYLIDGISVTDAYNGSVSIGVENSSVREMEVISGTFNAEYGQAMSGIVNIVTKDGGDKYEGFASGYIGNYYTMDSDLFQNLNKLGVKGPKDFQINLSGPTKILSGLNFFISGRYYRDDGYLYGRRVYNIWDDRPTFPDQKDQTFWINNNTGDSSYVSMNPSERKYINGKLTYGINTWKFTYSFFWDDNWNKYYNHYMKWTPDGTKNHYRTNYVHNFQVSYVPSQSTSLSFKFSSNLNKYKGYLFENEFDSRYADPNQGSPFSGYTFRSGGMETDRYDRFTQTYIGQLGLESQLSKHHKIKIGLEARFHEIFSTYKDIRNLASGQIDSTGQAKFVLGYSAPNTKFHTIFTRKPIEYSGFVQDKMEYDLMIINAGVRFDYFNSQDELPVDIRNPLNNPNFNGANQKRNAEAEYQISPRLGVSFPISDNGAIHFSYGHFFQIPNFENLYTNTAYIIDQTTSLSSVLGNPELKAQKTVKYELGLQQVLFPEVSLDVSVYYSDIRNLLGMQILSTYEGFLFGRFINRDYGNVKGLVLTLDKRFADFFSAKVDYTYQVASGNASDPFVEYNNNSSDPPVESNKKTVPLNWDQTHTLNISLTVGDPRDWTAGLVFNYGTGNPYTVDPRYAQGLRFENDGRRPAIYNVDLKANKHFNIFGYDVNTFILVYNLLDTRNEYGVYSSTGRANADLNIKFAGPIIGLNTIQQYINDPTFYSSPRRISIGFNVGF